MNFVKDKNNCNCQKILYSFIWFLIVFFFGNICFYLFGEDIILYPVTIDNIIIGFFSYFAYLIFRVLLSSFKSTFFEVKLKDENQKSGTEKYYQWYFGKEPLVKNKLLKKYGHFENIDTIIKYHLIENKVYETFSNRRFWNVFLSFYKN